MRIYIKPNLDKAGAGAFAHETAKKLTEIAKRRGEAVGIIFSASDRRRIGDIGPAEFMEEEDAVGACEIVISVGGDGTIMRAAQSAAKAGKPILGVNAGHVGFLTQLEAGELNELERLFTGNYGIFKRMMLKAEIGDNDQHAEYTSLNDIVIRHGDADKIVNIEVTQGSELIASHMSDGIIFSTPTGSTAYSMSAGGPIVSPELSVILITAICPHSAFNSTLVMPPEHRYTVREKPRGVRHGMYVSADGARVGKLKPDGFVTVSRSDTEARFVDLGLREYFSNLNQKLSWRR